MPPGSQGGAGQHGGTHRGGRGAAGLTAPPDAPRTPWGRVAALVLAGIAGAMQIGKVPGAMTAIAEEMGLTLAAAALPISLFSLLTALGGVAIGLSAARVGARRALVAGAALSALAALAAAAAPGFALLLAARVAEGAGFLLVVVAAPTLIAEAAAPRDRATAMACWSTYMPAGIALGLAAALLIAPLGWRGMWLVAAAAQAGAAALVLLAVPPARATVAARPAFAAQLSALVRARRPLAVALTFGIYNAVYMGIAGFLPAFLEARFGATPGAAGLVAAGAALANVAGNLGGGALMRRGWHPGLLVAAAGAAMGVLAASLFLAAPALEAAFLLALLASGIGGMVPASLFALAPRCVPSPALVAPAVGLVIQCTNLSALLAPPALGWAAGFGWGWLALPLLACGLAAAWGGWGLRRV